MCACTEIDPFSLGLVARGAGAGTAGLIGIVVGMIFYLPCL
jgi:hypothetical protein